MEILKTLGIEPEVIVANAISLLLLLWVLMKVMIKPIGAVLRDRREEIESSYQRIREETAKVEQTQAEVNRRLTEIETEARARIQEAGAEASRMKDQILAEARTQAEQVKERGIQDIERERDKALQSIRQEVADLVVQASEKVLGASMDDERHRDLIKSAIGDLENLKN